MRKKNSLKFLLALASGALVPFFTLSGSGWINLSGIGPLWSVLWLLPWALRFGPYSGAFAGLCLALILDGISLGGATNIPALVLLGYSWGRFSNSEPPFRSYLALAIMAWIGSIVIGLTLLIQNTYLLKGTSSVLFNLWSHHLLISQSLLTSILAPLVSFSLLKFFNTVSR